MKYKQSYADTDYSSWWARVIFPGLFDYIVYGEKITDTRSALQARSEFLAAIDDLLEIARHELEHLAAHNIVADTSAITNRPRFDDPAEREIVMGENKFPALRICATLRAESQHPTNNAQQAEIEQLFKALGKERESLIMRYGQMSLATPVQSAQAAHKILGEEKAAEHARVQGWRGPTVFMRQVWEKAEQTALTDGTPLTKHGMLEANVQAACKVTAQAVAIEWQKEPTTQGIPFNADEIATIMANSLQAAIDKNLDDIMTEFAAGFTPTHTYGEQTDPQITYLQTLEIQAYCQDINPQRADGRFYGHTINSKLYQTEWRLMRQLCRDIAVGDDYPEMTQRRLRQYDIHVQDAFNETLGMTLYVQHFEGNGSRLGHSCVPKLNPQILPTIMARLGDANTTEEQRKKLVLMANFVFDYQTVIEEAHIEMLQKLLDHRLHMNLDSGDGNRNGVQWKSYAPVPEGHPKLYELQQIINSRKALLAVRKTYSLYGKHARQEECKKAIPLAIGLALGALAIDVALTTATSYAEIAAISEELSREALKAVHALLHGPFEGFINACTAHNPVALTIVMGAVLGLVSLAAGAFVGAELSGQFGDTPEATRFFGQHIKQQLPAIQINP